MVGNDFTASDATPPTAKVVRNDCHWRQWSIAIPVGESVFATQHYVYLHMLCLFVGYFRSGYAPGPLLNAATSLLHLAMAACQTVGIKVTRRALMAWICLHLAPHDMGAVQCRCLGPESRRTHHQQRPFFPIELCDCQGCHKKHHHNQHK